MSLGGAFSLINRVSHSPKTPAILGLDDIEMINFIIIIIGNQAQQWRKAIHSLTHSLFVRQPTAAASSFD